MSGYFNMIRQTAEQLRQQLQTRIDCAVILGSGLADVQQHLRATQDTTVVPETILEVGYSELACLPKPTAPGHNGRLSIVRINGRIVAMCQGRAHLYEGYSAQEVCAMIYLLRALGTSQLVISNAAGALNPSFKPGQVMLIHDHINFSGHNPLIGLNEDFGSRFTDMSEPYSRQLSSKIGQHFPDCHQGVYVGVSGPSLETSAERRMLHGMGADAVGMSTVLEVIAARQCGIEVCGLSAITNLALGDEHQKADTIEEVLHYAGIAGKQISAIIAWILMSSPPVKSPIN